MFDATQHLIAVDVRLPRSNPRVVLSHRWGIVQYLKTDRATIGRYIKEGISQSEFPATFQASPSLPM